jgi:hypothetical protein
MAHNVSIPLTRWHARACRAVVCPQAVQAPSIQHLLNLAKVDSAHLRSPSTPLVEFCTRNAHAQREAAPLKMHR